MDLISVVIPVYKVEPYLRQCVDSILEQTYQNFEIILIDDESPDSCPEICDEYAKKDSRVKVIHQKNGGPAAARNSGIDWVLANSDSKWICFVDSDDWVHKQYLEALYCSVCQSGTNICKCCFVPAEKEIVQKVIEEFKPKVMKTEDAYLLKNSSVAPWGKIYRKECFENIRYPVGKFAEDMFTTYKLMFKYDSIAVLEDILYYYRTNPSSVTKSPWRIKCLDELEAFEEQLVFFKGKKMKTVYRTLLEYYMMAIGNQYNSIPESSISEEEKKYYSKLLKTKMKKAVLKNPKISWQARKKYGWCIGIAFPKIMSIYWKLSK